MSGARIGGGRGGVIRRHRSCPRTPKRTQAVDAQFIGAISKTSACGSLKVAGAAPAHFSHAPRLSSIFIFEIAPINGARVRRPPSPHSCQDRILTRRLSSFLAGRALRPAERPLARDRARRLLGCLSLLEDYNRRPCIIAPEYPKIHVVVCFSLKYGEIILN